jgi:hypothetical protein
MEPETEIPKPFKHRAKFVMIDPLAIRKELLYKVDGKYLIGLILCTEPGLNGKLRVEQAMPSQLLKAGKHRAPIVRNWHTLSEERWPGKGKAGSTPAS